MTKKLSEFTPDQRVTDAASNSRVYVSNAGTDKYVEHTDLVARSRHTGTQPLTTISDAGDLAGKDLAALTDIEPIAQTTILGNSGGVSANPSALTPAQARTLLNVADGATERF